MTAARKVLVIGAGLGGLSAAASLAAAGCDVTLLERARSPGGKMAEHSGMGFRFDTGPSLLTLPDVLNDVFREAGRDPATYLSVLPLDCICRYHFGNGKILNAWSDHDRFLAEVERSFGERENLTKFLAYGKGLYEASGDLFLRQPFESWRKLATGGVIETARTLRAIDPLRTVSGVTEKFFRSPELRQLFNRYATYTGSSPFRAPATLNVIPYVEFGFGGHYVEGGMFQIAHALSRLCSDLGVDLRFGEGVVEIRHRSGRVHAIESTARAYTEFDAVVCNSDVVNTYEHLLAPRPIRRHFLRRMEPSSSGLVLLLGVSRQTDLSVHNIFFAEDYRAEFESLARGEICDDPTVYVSITSKLTPSDAPEESENWFVLVNAPPVESGDLPEVWSKARAAVLRKLARMKYDISAEISYEDRVTPFDILQRTASNQGSIYGLSSNGLLSAFHRYPNRAPDIPNLYFAGGSVHPGGGIPLALLSGRHAASLVLRDLGSKLVARGF